MHLSANSQVVEISLLEETTCRNLMAIFGKKSKLILRCRQSAQMRVKYSKEHGMLKGHSYDAQKSLYCCSVGLCHQDAPRVVLVNKVEP